MLLKVITTAILLGLLIQQTEGFERVIVVRGSDIHGGLISDDEDTDVIGSGNGSFDNSCCVHSGICSCPSLYNALTNLTSNVLINIIIDVVLSSIIPLVDLANITITGHNNPTVNCNNSGGLHFISCHNCTIQGITWDECGARNITYAGNVSPVIRFYDSSNITLRSCTFQHSIGQAVVLSQMIGDVNIDHCNFLSNKQYEGHGTAINYNSSNVLYNSPLNVTITNCTFSYNEGAKSVTYFGQSSIVSLNLQNLKFNDNKGVPIYLINQNLHISRNIEFHNNTAENGGGMFISDHSNVTFHKSATVNFRNNRVNNNGGAIFLTNHSSVIFKENITCHDSQALPMEYIKVRFNKNTAKFGGAIYTANSSVIFGECAVVKITGNTAEQGGAVCGLRSTVSFEGNSVIKFIHNVADKIGGAMAIYEYSNITFQANSAVHLNKNSARNCGAMIIKDNCIVTFKDNSAVTFDSNSAQGSGAVGTSFSRFIFKGISRVFFVNNTVSDDDGGAWVIEKCSIKFQDNSRATFNTNRANNDGGGAWIVYSTITFKDNSIVMFNVNHAGYRGGALFIDSHSNVTFAKNSAITFFNNSAVDGGAMAILDYSSITFKENSTVTFNANSALNGGAGYIIARSMITFKGNSRVLFNSNNAHRYNGGALAIYMSSITVEEYSAITFIGNRAYKLGGAIRILNSAVATFGGNSTVMFNANKADQEGGACYIENHSSILFAGNSTTVYFNNSGNKGGAVAIYEHSSIKFKGDSTVRISNNNGDNGGALIINNCTMTLEENSAVTFNTNTADQHGGAHYIDNHSSVTFSGNSAVTYFSNSGIKGGAMAIHDYCTVTFKGNSTVKLSNNRALGGGAIITTNNCTVTFTENSTVTFNANKANFEGGAVSSEGFSHIIFGGDSTVSFYNNGAFNGGALAIYNYSNIIFKGNSIMNLHNNSAYDHGGAMTIKHNCIAIFEGNSQITFNDNKVKHDGGACYIEDHSNITLVGKSAVTFNNNSADVGGAVMVKDNCVVILEDNCTVTFNYNNADSGGALMISETSTVSFKGNCKTKFNMNIADHVGGAVHIAYYCTVTFDENSTTVFHGNAADYNGGVMYINQHSFFESKGNTEVTFNTNKADLGGSIFIESSNVTIEENSSAKFINNTARQNGGAIYLSDRSIFMLSKTPDVNFYFNTAGDYGGAVYVLLKKSSMNFNNSSVDLIDNTAGKMKASVYIKLPESCKRKCLDHSVNGNLNKTELATSPNKLTLYNPAKCINGNDTNCDTYYMNNIMLGQEITLDACLLDYYDQPTEAAEFVITGMSHQDYNISGSKYITITCNRTTQGISVIGNLHSNKSYNYSIIISLYVVHISDSKIVSATLTIELSQCHPGFWYFSKSQKCECYNFRNVVSCSGSRSTIKRGYWFGSVTGKPTVTLCPSDYCNFTCCEIANGVYHLSPVRANQCRPHRFGTACGNCEKGYTLSFDSSECVEVNKCTIGTVLVTTLSLLYWIAVVVTVFAMMYFKVTVGSLYAIVYYYSVVDTLLGQVLLISNGLYTTVSIMSSLAKLTPQFLGQLCLVRNMSGIDQQFIHYVHPVVILFILIMISVLTRRSHRLSSFVSRGIIHFICFLLLLSYTSVASTSLLLMRPLKFIDIDKVYTYLSPDIEYFHDRHIAYVIVAIIFTIMFVIGFPLLLLLEPFLNSKINFIKIKPLLDQFQGSYKDKYRCFAGYYMICRLVIILLVIVKISDDFTTQYLLISSCALMQLIHVLVRPYISTIHNVFDGIILQLIVIISVLPIVEFVDNYDETFVLVIICLLVILPLMSFISIKLWINRENIQNTIKYLRIKCYYKYHLIPTDDSEAQIEENEFDTIVDDNMRRNSIIVDVNEPSEERLPDIMWCRDPFMEQLNEIEALNDIRN